ncbi:MAG: ABC transporter substrate-binding protein [Pseudomonadota bacterium]
MYKKIIIILISSLLYSTFCNAATYVSPMPSLNLVLDPVKAAEGFSFLVINQMCDRLVTYDEKLNIVPQLAKKWSVSNDGLTYTFVLRENVYFHDGRSVKATDVVWSLTRMLKRSSVKFHELSYIKGAVEYHNNKVKTVTGIRAKDNVTIEIELTRPYPPVLSVLSAPGAEIFPKLKDEKSEMQFFKAPICAGPYRLIKRTNNLIKLEAFNKYYEKADRTEFIEFRLLKRKDAIQCFIDKQCHDLRWYFMAPDELSGDYKIEKSEVAHVNIIAFNAARYPFSDPNVRKAITMAIDREKLRKLCYPDKRQAHGYIPTGLGGYDLHANEIQFDPVRAKKILEKIGLNKSVLRRKYTLIRMTNYMCQDNFKKFIETSLGKIGLNVEVVHVPPDMFVNKYLYPRNYDMTNFTMTSDYSEAYFLLNYFRSNYPSNYTGLKDEKIDNMLDESTKVDNRYERYKIYRNIQNRLLELAPIINMYHDIWVTYYQGNIVDYQNTSLSIYNTLIRNVRFIGSEDRNLLK